MLNNMYKYFYYNIIVCIILYTYICISKYFIIEKIISKLTTIIITLIKYKLYWKLIYIIK